MVPMHQLWVRYPDKNKDSPDGPGEPNRPIAIAPQALRQHVDQGFELVEDPAGSPPSDATIAYAKGQYAQADPYVNLDGDGTNARTRKLLGLDGPSPETPAAKATTTKGGAK